MRLPLIALIARIGKATCHLKKMRSSYTLATLNPVLKKDEQLENWLDFQKLILALKEKKLKFNSNDLKQFLIVATNEQKQTISRAIAAKDKLVYSSQALVIKMAEQYHNEAISKEELIQQGNLGIMRALVKFTPQKNTKFSSYAYFWIKALIFEALHRINPIYIPPKVRKEMKSYGYVSLSEGERPLEIASDEIDNCSLINSILSKLTAQEQEILSLSFGFDGDCQGDMAVALALGCSIEEARDRVDRAISKAKESV